MVKKIELSQGQFALVDDEDFEYLNQWKWYVDKHKHVYYAVRGQYLGCINGKQKQKKILMHRLILNAPQDLMVDHINGNGIDNRKSNLRLCSRRQNYQNIKHKNMSSQYPGVSWDKSKGKWRASININGVHKHLKLSFNERECAKAYEKACRELIGEELICKS